MEPKAWDPGQARKEVWAKQRKALVCSEAGNLKGSLESDRGERRMEEKYFPTNTPQSGIYVTKS